MLSDQNNVNKLYKNEYHSNIAGLRIHYFALHTFAQNRSFKRVTMSNSFNCSFKKSDYEGIALVALNPNPCSQWPKRALMFWKANFLYMLYNILFTYPKSENQNLVLTVKEGLRVMKQFSSLFHAAPDRNWFLRLMSHRCAKEV